MIINTLTMALLLRRGMLVTSSRRGFGCTFHQAPASEEAVQPQVEAPASKLPDISTLNGQTRQLHGFFKDDELISSIKIDSQQETKWRKINPKKRVSASLPHSKKRSPSTSCTA